MYVWNQEDLHQLYSAYLESEGFTGVEDKLVAENRSHSHVLITWEEKQ
ncbi:hypothetical protein PAECIP111893_01287 [Paenibacillus plantiphilus]|uniref:Uncharacterized protein n=1 Tax=Paenibacillus plantiphilus TaxID=2905650 RepID=A0ABM9BZ73_9BACL|nr:hypothetical protein [Paenibacillus plantiphilus]CAH1199271.1 hypothetical protein PAECIP111893_01287 [Paenibacillus plantiphilus]